MSTQTQTPADLAVKFLEKYATVIGTLDAIERKDREFLLKYATVVGSIDAIDLVAPEDPGAPTVIDDQGGTGSTGDTGSTGSDDDQDPTNDAGVGEGTDDQGD